MGSDGASVRRQWMRILPLELRRRMFIASDNGVNKCRLIYVQYLRRCRRAIKKCQWNKADWFLVRMDLAKNTYICGCDIVLVAINK